MSKNNHFKKLSRVASAPAKTVAVPTIKILVKDNDMESQRDSFFEKALYDQQKRVLTPEQLIIARAAIGRE